MPAVSLLGHGHSQRNSLWVPITGPRHATWAYSWMSPSSRSTHTTRTSLGGVICGMAPSGGAWLSAVWSMLVVVRYIACQHRRQLPSAQDQYPVEQLTADGADPPFLVGVRPRRPHRRAQDPDALGAKDRIEAVGEFRVPVADEEPEQADAIPKVHEQVASLLGDPPARRVRRHPQNSDASAGDLEHEQHVQAPEQHRVDMEAVARQDALGLGGQELPPGQPCAAWRRVDAGALEQQPHGARRDPVAKLHEFAMDAPISPGRVLRRYPHDQAPQLRGCRWSSGRAVGMAQWPRTRAWCQRSRVSGVTKRWCRRCLGRSLVKAARTARSGHVARGLVTCRHSTPTSCRSGVLGGLAAGKQCEPAEELAQDQVEESERHGQTSSPLSGTDAKPHVKLIDDVPAPTGQGGRGARRPCREQRGRGACVSAGVLVVQECTRCGGPSTAASSASDRLPNAHLPPVPAAGRGAGGRAAARPRRLTRHRLAMYCCCCNQAAACGGLR
jgi:hypothetical protein